MEQILKQFREAGKLLSEQSYSVGDDVRLLLQTREGVFTVAGAHKLANIQESDIEQAPMKELPMAAKGKMAMIYSMTPYCQKCLAEALPFEASLDDTAMIVGPSVFIADGRDANKKMGTSLKRSLKKSDGCFVLRGVGKNGKGMGYTVTLGRTLKEAATALTVLEKSAETEYKAQRLGGTIKIGKRDRKQLRRKYLLSYSRQVKYIGEEAPAFSEEELALRQQLVQYGKRLVSKGLVQGTWGNLSIRLDAENMLITPSGIGYDILQPEDMVKVHFESGKATGLNKPSSEKDLHIEIYKHRSDVGAIVHAHSEYASVFAAACKNIWIDEEEHPEYFNVFGEKIALAPYAPAGSKGIAKVVCEALGDGQGALMAHHGMVACGTDMENAFQNSLMLEAAGKQHWTDYDKDR